MSRQDHTDSSLLEAERIMTICNACRYCEGHCAVFPAMELRLDFAKADLNYLANLCHNCGACFHHCQYAEPHEFKVNVPRTFAELRRQSYAEYAWPGLMRIAFEKNGFWVAAVTIVATIAFILLTALITGPATFLDAHDNATQVDAARENLAWLADHGVHAVVGTSTHGCYAEIPDDIVFKVAPDQEHRELTQVLQDITSDYSTALARAAMAQNWAIKRHAPEAYAGQLLEFIQTVLYNQPVLRLVDRVAGHLQRWDASANGQLIQRLDRAVQDLFSERTKPSKAA